MVDERFSAKEFSARGLDTEEAQKLADLLAEEIQAEINEVAEAKMNEIVERLNKMGHDLK
jgi:hypothetical protein